jgi:S-adenosylmethionine:tRNA ribosyltransferase-isomerase
VTAVCAFSLEAPRFERETGNPKPSRLIEARRPSGSGAAPELGVDAVPRQQVRLVVMDRAADRIETRPFAALAELLRAGDVIVVNDAATLPGSLFGVTADGARFELRLVGPPEGARLHAVLLGEGDWRTRTEDRPPPPRLAAGDRVMLGGAPARIAAADGRRVTLEVTDPWHLIYARGAPVQYAYRHHLLPLYEVQTAFAARPWAAEMPSAGRPLTWEVIVGLRRAGVRIVALTHAAGLSSTGEPALDRALPWPERYELPARTARAIASTRASGGRVIAIGTSVVRALEASGGAPGSGTATLRLDSRYTPRIVDGIVSGLHVPGESHHELLSAFAPAELLERGLAAAAAAGMSAHELGDACLIA